MWNYNFQVFAVSILFMWYSRTSVNLYILSLWKYTTKFIFLTKHKLKFHVSVKDD